MRFMPQTKDQRLRDSIDAQFRLRGELEVADSKVEKLEVESADLRVENERLEQENADLKDDRNPNE